MRVLLWIWILYSSGLTGGKEPTDLLIPQGWKGNPWGPVATAARKSGELPPIVDTPIMKEWDEWARKHLKTGDILFRRGDARILAGFFPFSRFIANVSGSQYSHIGTLVFEDGEPVVYDTTKASVRRQPLKVWVLDNTGPFGVKRLKAPYRNRIPKVVEYLNSVYQKQVPFDYELSTDDRELYCVEMAEKAFRHAGLTLSEPILLADMERINEFPLCVMGFTTFTSLKLDQQVFFPGNERHGIWSSPLLETVCQSPMPEPGHVGVPHPPKVVAAATASANPPSTSPANPPQPGGSSVAGRPGQPPRN